MRIKLSNLKHICNEEQERFKRLFKHSAAVNEKNLLRYTRSRWGTTRSELIASVIYDCLRVTLRKRTQSDHWLEWFRWGHQERSAIINAGLEAIKTGKVTEQMLRKHGIELSDIKLVESDIKLVEY